MIKKTACNWQRYSGVVGVLVIWTGVTMAMRRVGLGLVDSRPISYLGVDPVTATLFSVSLIISALLFINFAYYVRRAFRIHNRYLTYFLIGQAGQLVAAVTPYGDQSPYRLTHTIAAFTLAFSLPLLMRQFTRSQKSSSHYKLYELLLQLELLAFIVGIGLFVFAQGIAPLGQVLPAAGFHLWIIIITWRSL
jgi:hypothetical membrane protein